jgi:Cu-processing system permease protein
MGRVGRSLIVHELLERTRDRWVLVITALFAVLAMGIVVYGSAAGASAAVITGPSLVTLATFLVPLVALVLGHDAIVGERERHTLGLLLSLPVSRGEVLVAKFLGRALALSGAVAVGLGSAGLWLPPGQRSVVLSLVPQTLLLGLCFLSVGVFISTAVSRIATAASLAVVCWFSLVFFYDLGLLALLVGTDGAVSQDAVVWLVSLNPAGLYRTGLMMQMVGETSMTDLGLTSALPGSGARALIWTAWTVLPLLAGSVLLNGRRAVTR